MGRDDAAVADAIATRLPRGRHRLSREEVEQAQRTRIVTGMAQAMASEGYVGTPVAEVLKRAGVSRETFYRLYSSKLDCFLDALDFVGEVLVVHLVASLGEPGAPMPRFERALDSYLEMIVAEPAYARLFLVEVYAAGPEAMARRAALQQRIVDALAQLFDARNDKARFACQALVASVASMVTLPIVTDDLDAVRSLGPPLRRQVRAQVACGLLGRG